LFIISTCSIEENDVRRFAKVDRDLRQINIMLGRGNTDAAKDLYRYGRNMVIEDSIPTSLRSLAREFNNREQSGDRNRLYIMFEEYHENNQAYADQLVWDAFVGTKAALQVTIPRILQTIVIPHFALRKFFEAADMCEENSLLASSIDFDKGVAVLVGSFEGIKGGGSRDGLSWLSLTKELCPEFNCNDAKNPLLNVQMLKNIRNGRKAIKDNNCTNLKFYVRKMESILIIPIIQGLLYYAKMRQDQPTLILHYETAKVFAQAIMPLVKKVDVDQAFLIEKNIFNKIGDKTNADEVWSAIFYILEDLGIKCEDVGSPNLILNGNSFCEYKADKE